MMTVYRCECGHKCLDHDRQDGARCSYGGCRCTRSTEHVRQDGTEEQILTTPGFDAASGKWDNSRIWR